MAGGSDVRQAVRSIVQRPTLAAAAILSLTIGIGANATLLSLVDGLGLRPIPIDRPERLVRVFTTHDASTSDNFSLAEYHDVDGHVPAFSALAAYGIRGVGLTGPERAPEVTMLGVVSGNYFEMLGVHPDAGRVLHESEPARAVAMISRRLWDERYLANPAALDRGIELNGRMFAVAGVLPRDFGGLDALLAPDVWIPFDAWTLLNGASSELTDRGNRWIRVVGRLRDGSGLDEASTQVGTLMSRLASAYPATNARRASRVMFDVDYRRRISRVAAAVFGAIGAFVLLLACANVAGLLIARSEERRYEMAVRAAMGASRFRLVQRLLTESAVLAAAAAAGGLALAGWLIRLLPAVIPPAPFPLGLAFRLDVRVTVFAVLLAVLTLVLFGLAPALTGSRADTGAILKDASTGMRRGRSGVRQVLVAGQIAVSLALVTVSVFLVRDLRALNRVDAGFDRRPMLMVAMSPSALGYDEARSRAFYQALIERVAAMNGVERVALAKRAPLSLSGGGATEIVRVPGYEPPAGQPGFSIHSTVVGAGYFETIGTPLVLGRDFSARDTRQVPRVAIVSQAFASRFWPGESAIGKRVGVGPGTATPCEVVGVARDVKYNSLGESPDPYIYFPFSQRFAGEATLLVRTRGGEHGLIAPLRQAMESLDRAVPAMQIETMSDHMHTATAIERLSASLVSGLGLLGLFLALVGLYGLASYLVRCRVREIGIRMALGARPIDIARHVLMQTAVPVACGLGAGLVLAFAVARLTARSVEGAGASDPLVYAGVALVLTITTAAASAVPARRAARLDPSRVLRRD